MVRRIYFDSKTSYTEFTNTFTKIDLEGKTKAFAGVTWQRVGFGVLDSQMNRLTAFFHLILALFSFSPNRSYKISKRWLELTSGYQVKYIYEEILSKKKNLIPNQQVITQPNINESERAAIIAKANNDLTSLYALPEGLKRDPNFQQQLVKDVPKAENIVNIWEFYLRDKSELENLKKTFSDFDYKAYIPFTEYINFLAYDSLAVDLRKNVLFLKNYQISLDKLSPWLNKKYLTGIEQIEKWISAIPQDQCDKQFDQHFSRFCEDYSLDALPFKVSKDNQTNDSAVHLNKMYWDDFQFQSWALRHPQVIRNYIVFHRNPLMALLKNPALWSCFSQLKNRKEILIDAFKTWIPRESLSIHFGEKILFDEGDLEENMTQIACHPEWSIRRGRKPIHRNPGGVLIRMLEDEQIKDLVANAFFGTIKEGVLPGLVNLYELAQEETSENRGAGALAALHYFLSSDKYGEESRKIILKHCFYDKMDNLRWFYGVDEVPVGKGKWLTRIKYYIPHEIIRTLCFDGEEVEKFVKAIVKNRFDRINDKTASENDVPKICHDLISALKLHPKAFAEQLKLYDEKLLSLCLDKSNIETTPLILELAKRPETSSWLVQSYVKTNLNKHHTLFKDMCWDWDNLPDHQLYLDFMTRVFGKVDFIWTVPLEKWNLVKKMLGGKSDIKRISLTHKNAADLKQFDGIIDPQGLHQDILSFVEKGGDKEISQPLSVFFDQHSYKPFSIGDDRSDFKIICNGKEFFVHKSVLKRFPTFAALENFKENKELIYDEVSDKAMEALLDYIYQGKKSVLANLDFASSIEVFHVLSLWLIEDSNAKEMLLEKITIAIIQNPNIDNKTKKYLSDIINEFDLKFPREVISWVGNGVVE